MNIKEAISRLRVIKDNIAISTKRILTETGEIKQDVSIKELEELKNELIGLANQYRLCNYELFNQDYINSETWKKELELYENLIFIANHLVDIKVNHGILIIPGEE